MTAPVVQVYGPYGTAPGIVYEVSGSDTYGLDHENDGPWLRVDVMLPRPAAPRGEYDSMTLVQMLAPWVGRGGRDAARKR